MNEMAQKFFDQIGIFSPNLLGALLVLVVGWIVAIIAAGIARKVLGKTSIDNKVANWMAEPGGKPVPVEEWGARLIFYLIMLLVLVAFFQTLHLTVVTEPINNLLKSFVGAVPNILRAGLYVLMAWIIGTVARKLVSGALQAAKLDEKLGSAAGEPPKPGQKPMALSQSLSDAVYWLVFLFFIPPVLEALGMQALLEPVNSMLSKFLSFLPNLMGASITVIVGWFVARIVQRIVTSLLASAGVDGLADRWGLGSALGKQKFSQIIGLVLYCLILTPVVIAGLDQLKMEAITRPASEMLGRVFNLVPQLFGAALILIIAWVVAKVVGGLVANLLAGLGFNNVMVKLGLARQAIEGKRAPAAVVGMVVGISIQLTAATAAAETLGLDGVRLIIQDFIGFAGRVVLGLILFGLGLALAQVVSTAVSAAGTAKSRLTALVAKIGITVMVGAMALRATGVADSIVNLSFGALVIGLAAAGALAFGFGGRRVANELLASWKSSFDRQSKGGN